MFSLNYFRLSASRARSLGFLSQNLERDLILYSWNFLLLFDWQDLHKKTVEKGMYDEKGSGGWGVQIPTTIFPPFVIPWNLLLAFLSVDQVWFWTELWWEGYTDLQRFLHHIFYKFSIWSFSRCWHLLNDLSWFFL